MTLTILHVDHELLVVSKPAFLRSTAPEKHREKPSVLDMACQSYPNARIVHRLDMDTSGLMVLALGEESQRALNQQFQARQVFKQYTAIAAGHLSERWGCIDLPIIKDWPNRPRQRIDFRTGKQALSYYRVDERFTMRTETESKEATATRLTLFPETGRSHQLRIHLRCLGHPLAGCDLYGTEHSYGMSSRLLLHASRLAFTHPTTGKPFVIEHAAPF